MTYTPRVVFLLGLTFVCCNLLCFSNLSLYAQQKEAIVSNPSTQTKTAIYDDSNLVAWCIVPFDAKRRNPQQRAEMLVELGIKRCAYDWREEHVPTFEDEILQYKKHGIEFFAFWSVHDSALALFEKHDLHPQIWQMIGDPGGEADSKVARAAEKLVPLAKRTQQQKLPLGLYNHMGWDGEPENMVAVCKRLHEMGFGHVGIVYNFHHGHDHIGRMSEALKLMMPYLLCVNINGMNDGANPKILGLGKGKYDTPLLQTLQDSGYKGRVGIIDHRPELDAGESLLENLDGLRKIRTELKPPPDLQSNNAKGGFDPAIVERLVHEATERGSASRGAAVFGSDHTACVSCHQVRSGDSSIVLGGNVGPDLRPLLKERSAEQIVESLFWPDRQIDPNYRLWQAVTADGRVVIGVKQESAADKVVLKEISSGKLIELEQADVDDLKSSGTPMPAELTDRLSRQQQLDLIAFLLDIRRTSSISDPQFQAIKSSHNHGPATFPITKQPINAKLWPNHSAHVNRDRIYDFYTKQAEYFRALPAAPMLLSQFPGLDGGDQGHWGNQNEKTWEDGRWNDAVLGTLQAGVFREGKLTVSRGICLQLGDQAELACCFDPDTLSYRAVWQGGFVSFSSFRHGFIDGLKIKGKLIDSLDAAYQTGKTGKYLGLYRVGKRVVFAYEEGGKVIWDAPWVSNGKFTSEIAPAESHSLRASVSNGPANQWPEQIKTSIIRGEQKPFSIDTIELPFKNPWNAPVFPGGHDFLPDGSALVCTIQGDVWRVTGLQKGSDKATWKRFASGLHHPLDLLVDQDGIFVQCRDQLVRLHDTNGDHEADFYECFSKAFETSPAGHDYICGLQRDSGGNFYTATGNQGLVKISADGQRADVIATGFRNPDGLGILPNGTVTVPCSEGEWTPSSMICAVPTGKSVAATDQSDTGKPMEPLHYGYLGPKNGKPPELPLSYLPRAMDNSSGGQAVVPRGSWGPMSEQLLHLSFGAGSWFTVLINEVSGQLQGGVVPMAGDFNSSVHRGRFSKKDGHFYVSGMHGWGAYTRDDGCFQRIRFTGDRFQQPVSFHAHRNGIVVRFAEPIDAVVAKKTTSHFAQAWNYRYSAAYGSSEYSPSHPGVEGHDSLAITKAVVVEPRTLFLEIPDLRPVNQLHLRLHVNEPNGLITAGPTGSGHDMFLTIHRLDQDFSQFEGYQEIEKTVAAHPLLVDMAMSAVTKPNPWAKPVAENEATIAIETGKNLTFQQTELRVKAGQPTALEFINSDVVPHNWVLVQPDQLKTIGELSNKLIANPEGYARHYVPESADVIVYTDIVQANQKQIIHFKAPTKPGRYPYLCTFPGHWMVMNGVMIVE
jgi:putative heme-binding domain-containing protein